jgi:hypothetical protein
MGVFTNWVKKKAIFEDLNAVNDPVDRFKFNDGGPDPDKPFDYEKVRSELFKLVMDKYPDETMRFLHDIAQRGDTEVKTLLAQMNAGRKPKEFREPPHSSSQDEVVPSSADAAHGPGDGGQ